LILAYRVEARQSCNPEMTKTATSDGVRVETPSVDPAMLASANRWFDVSWYGLLIAGVAAAIAAGATVIFLFIQYWSGGVRERHTEWRTSSLELKAAEARRDTVAALECIAGLDNQTERLKADNLALQTAMNAGGAH
jgi:hypothetical protein